MTRFELPYKKQQTDVTRQKAKPKRSFAQRKGMSPFVRANYIQISTLVQIILLCLTNLPGLHVLFVIALILIYINIALARYSLLAKFMFIVASTFPMLFMIEFAQTVGAILYFSITSLIVNTISFLSLLTDYIVRLKKQHVISLRQHRSTIGILLLVAIVVIFEISTLTRITSTGMLALIGNVPGALLPTDLPPIYGLLITVGCIIVLVYAYYRAKAGGVTDVVTKVDRKKEKERDDTLHGYQVT